MKLHDKGVYLVDGKLCDTAPVSQEEARKGTMAYSILKAHNTTDDMNNLRLKFDSMTSHDITYVGIIQTARASGMDKFPLPYVMTNCHNTLCAVGGTINEDDHQFALSAAHKYGGIYVPPSMAVIHSYNREMMSGCGRMILGSDSHTRYGALGTMAVGEGGGELAKQLVGRTYDMAYPGVVAIYLTGKLNPGVGPQDVALALVGATYANGYVKNKVMEFVGPGIASLSADCRNGIDVMTTETTCWSSIWETDGVTKEYFDIHGRPEAYKELKPADVAYYDGCIELDLSTIECMIALPMHPSYAYPIRELKANAKDILHEIETRANEQLSGKVHMDLVSKVAADGSIRVDQGVVAGCSGGTFENVCDVAAHSAGQELRCGYLPAERLPRQHAHLPGTGQKRRGGRYCLGGRHLPRVLLRTLLWCRRYSGQWGVLHPSHHPQLPQPGRLQARRRPDRLPSPSWMPAPLQPLRPTAVSSPQPARSWMSPCTTPEYHFDVSVYDKRVYNGWGHAEPEHELKFGPNIKDWPEQPALSEDLLLKVVSYITDPVTTTDELIPSGETSSFRSNPLRLAEFTLSRKDPGYVGRAKAVKALDDERRAGTMPAEVQAVYDALAKAGVQAEPKATNVGSAVFANKPGDGSAREQAASCQRVLGGAANFAREYATKRYRSNCINWGMLPFLVEDPSVFALGDYVFVPGARKALLDAAPEMTAYAVAADGKVTPFAVRLGDMTADERQILANGCLINYYKNN